MDNTIEYYNQYATGFDSARRQGDEVLFDEKTEKACKMGVSGAKEVKFTTGLPLLQEEKNK